MPCTKVFRGEITVSRLSEVVVDIGRGQRPGRTVIVFIMKQFLPWQLLTTPDYLDHARIV